MKYFYNKNYGTLFYPENWWDSFRCFLTKLIHPKFKRTWVRNPYWYKRPHVAGCIELKLKETNYPDEASC